MIYYDVIVIGAGSGGLTSAFTAAGFGKKVVIIDKERPGGECTWSGCIPSKALINESKKVFQITKEIPDYLYDSKKALDHVHSVRENVYSHETPEVLNKSGIEYIQGVVSFIDSKTIKVRDKIIKGNKIIISTGSSPLIPPIKGLDSIPYLTNDTIFNLDKLPSSLIILGGGPIGIELAQAINRLGSRVEIVEMMPHLIFREEEDFARAIEGQLTLEGVKLHLNAKAVHTEYSKQDGISLTCEQDGYIKQVKAEALLVATGRKPNLEKLKLENAGIEYTPKGVTVNKKLQTTNRAVYAVGDIVGPYLFSHMANVQGILATQNAILPIQRKINYDNVAWVIFTEPEIARAGVTEEEAKKKFGDKIRVYEFDFNQLDRAMTSGKTNEKIKVILNKKGKVLGVSILANRAGEMIGEIQLIRSLKKNFSKMGSIIHPYPTYSDVFSKIGKQVLIDNILSNPIIKLFRR